MGATFFINDNSTWMPSGYYAVPIMAAVMAEMGQPPDRFLALRTGDWEWWNGYGIDALDPETFQHFLNAAVRVHKRYLTEEIWLETGPLFGQDGRYFNFAFVFNELVALLKEDPRATAGDRASLTIKHGRKWQVALPQHVDDLLLSHLIGFCRQHEENEEKALARQLSYFWDRSENSFLDIEPFSIAEQDLIKAAIEKLWPFYDSGKASPVSKGLTLFPVLAKTLEQLHVNLGN